jgi:Na+-translocating ferredoxin:NAD+ oxidoreductase subunit C
LAKRVFPGGIAFSELALRKVDPEPVSLAPPSEVALPLEDHFGEAEVLVRQGDVVEMGRRLNEGTRSAHASIAGVVAEVRSYAVRRNRKETIVVVRQVEDGASAEVASAATSASDESPSDLHSVLVGAGILPPAAQGKGPGHYETVVLRAFGEEPTIAHDAIIARTRAEKVVSGLTVLAGALGAKQIVIAVAEDDQETMAALGKVAEENVRVIAVTGRYPVGLPRVLRRAMAVAGVSASEPSFIATVSLALAAEETMRSGQPYTKKWVTVGRLDTGEVKLMEVPLGTRFREVVKALGAEPEKVKSIVEGGLLTGAAQVSLDQPVTKLTSGLFFRAGGAPLGYEPEPCIRCGKCVELCPAGLLPAHLERVAMRGQMADEKVSYLACVECGTCAYVCPAHRELVQWIRMARHTLIGDVPGEEA